MISIERFRFAYLLISLVLVVFVRPFIESLALGGFFVDAMLALTLIAGALSVIDTKRALVMVGVLGVIAIGTQVWWSVRGAYGVLVAYLVCTMLVYVCVSGFMVRALFSRQGAVTRDTLCQAFSVYLLFGLIWAIGYALLELHTPGSFSIATTGLEREDRFDRFLGFSLTTLTTLGYGNIAPTNARADALATAQATVGQVYIAVVIARLVAIWIAQDTSDQNGDQLEDRRGDGAGDSG
jgi:hypothetical protein